MMRAFLIVLIFISLLLVPDVSVAADSKDGAIVERETYQFPSYEKALQTTKIRNITSKEEYERAIRDTNFEFQRFEVHERWIEGDCLPLQTYASQ